jgi:hypothetical protein
MYGDSELTLTQQVNLERDVAIDNLVAGRMTEIYSEWLLEGEIGGPFNPTVVVSVFPEDEELAVRVVALQSDERFTNENDGGSVQGYCRRS